MLTHPQMFVISPVFALLLFLAVDVLDTPLLASGAVVVFGVVVGFVDGVFVGCVVGVSVGAAVGVLVGVTVGVSVGVTVGVSVGVTLGVSVGAGVGSSPAFPFFQVKVRS